MKKTFKTIKLKKYAQRVGVRRILLILFITIGTIVGLLQSYALEAKQSHESQLRYAELTRSLQKVLNQKAVSDTELKQKAATEGQLKAEIESLQSQLQSKKAQEQRVALAPTGYGGASAPVATSFANGYAWGNCTWFVASLVHVPDGWGNANAWDDNARAEGYTVTLTPRIGAIAQTDAGYWGHVALVEAIIGDQVEVKEMNYQGLNIIDERWSSVSDWVYIYI